MCDFWFLGLCLPVLQQGRERKSSGGEERKDSHKRCSTLPLESNRNLEVRVIQFRDGFPVLT